jgi:hypothetical protein
VGGFHVGGVQEQVGELDVIEAAFTKLADGDVKLGADPRHVTPRDVLLRDARSRWVSVRA